MIVSEEIIQLFPKHQAIVKQVYIDGSIGFRCATLKQKELGYPEIDTFVPDTLYPKYIQKILAKIKASS